jgi:hypothetical protein
MFLSLEANRGGELLRVLDQRQAQGANRDPLVGDAEADRLGELVLGEKSAPGSTTSPSLITPPESGAIATCETWRDPFAPISAAATLAASRSRPTTDFCLLVESIASTHVQGLRHHRPYSTLA